MEESIQPKKPLLIQVGAKVRVEFISMTHDAKGVCKLNGVNKWGEELTNFPIFVPNAITGEAGIIEITSLKKTLGSGRLIKVFPDHKSDYRVNPICPLFEECGGCHIMHLSYEGQLAFKQVVVRQTLKTIGGIEDAKVLPTMPSVEQLFYRNKVQIPFGTNGKKTICGFYKNTTHDIIPFEDCYIQSKQMSEIVKFIRNLCNEYHIKGYDEKKQTGDIRHVLLREAKKTGEVMVVLVLTKRDIPNLKELTSKLVKRFPAITSVMLNVNNANTNVILGSETATLYGKANICDDLLSQSYLIHAHSFFQVNPKTCEKLYEVAIKKAKLKPTDQIIDAYCGIGTIGLSVAKKVKHVYGVEIVPEAIENAIINAKNNGIDNATFVCGKAEEQIMKWKNDQLPIDAIFVDPPRRGLDISLMNAIHDMKIPKIIYISCDIGTMARDIKYLKSLDYIPSSFQPVDMFPQTLHVECLVGLYLKDKRE